MPSLTVALALALTSQAVQAASERAELLELKNTIVNLVDALVEQKVLTPEQAINLKREAADKARLQAANEPAEVVTEALPADAPGKKIVRVPYVPEFVKKEIREQVRAELREDVLADVSQKAKQERWGTPDALPAWVNSIKISGDARVRNQFDNYGKDNADTLSAQNLYLDIPRVNAAGGISQAGARAFLNNSDDENRWRERVRINLRAGISDHWSFDARLATGDLLSPISTNQSLGDYGRGFNIHFDRMAMLYALPAAQGMGWLNSNIDFSAGRMANPFLSPWASTELVWDEDLNLDDLEKKAG